MATKEQILAESTRVAQEAAKSIGGTFKQGEGFTPSKEKTTPTGTPQSSNQSSNKLMESVVGQLFTDSGMVSSSNTEIENAISSAIGSTERAVGANTERIESVFDREIESTEGNLRAQRDQFFEGRRGFATSTAALERLNVDTEKTLRDLDQRKQELILQGEATGAERISNLQVQALEFQQQAKQQAFTNMLSIGQFALGVQAQQTAKQQFEQGLKIKQEELAFSQRLAKTDIATQYGLEMEEGDTIESLSTRAATVIQKDKSLDRRVKEAQLAELQRKVNEIDSAKEDLHLDAGLMTFIEGGDNAYTAALSVSNQVGASQEQFQSLLDRAVELKKDYDIKIQEEIEANRSFVSIGAEDVWRRLTDPTHPSNQRTPRNTPESISDFLLGMD